MYILSSCRKPILGKKISYCPLEVALRHHSDAGWLIVVFPWVVGIRGLVDVQTIHAVLKFLDIPKKKGKAAVDGICHG